MSKLADLIWKNAELLRGAYKENEYRKVILPFTILRRLDCVLQSTREAVWARHAAVQGKGYDLDKMLTPVSGYPFFNTSKFTLPNIAETPDDVRDIARPALRHRIALVPELQIEGQDADDVLGALLAKVEAPRR